MDPRFEIAAGSIPGRDHVGRGSLLVGRNNQDAFSFRQGPEGTVAAVCDGCSGGARSEVGAALGARWVVAAAWEELASGRLGGDPGAIGVAPALERVRRRCLARLRLVARTLGPELRAAVEECLLFTVVLGVLAPRQVLVAAVGDGLVVANGELLRLGPFPGNAPPYLGYGLMEDPPGDMQPEDLGFRLVFVRPTEEVRHLVLGTDGAEDFIRAEHAPLPGRAQTLGSLAQLWTEDRYFRSPDALRRRLALANSEPITPDERTGAPSLGRGLLRDDTTLVVVRRRSEGVDGSAPDHEGRAP